jgi:Trpc4-associated protein
LDVVASSVVVAAVGLAEEVLAVRDDTLRVQDIPNFASLIHKFSSHQLALFCRVLAMVVFEPEAGNWIGEVEVGLNRSNAETGASKLRLEEQEWTVADRNHDAILLIPDILSRLVKLLMFDKVSFSREVGQVNKSPCYMIESQRLVLQRIITNLIA